VPALVVVHLGCLAENVRGTVLDDLKRLSGGGTVKRAESEDTKHVYQIELQGLRLHRWALDVQRHDVVLRLARDWRERLGDGVNVAYKAPGENAGYIDF
jgi:hypothetical protein